MSAADDPVGDVSVEEETGVRNLNEDPWWLLETLPEPEREWPVIVQTVTEYVVWVHAETHEKAVELAKDDGDIHEAFTNHNAVEGWWEVQKDRPDGHTLAEAASSKPYGPWPWCSACESVIFLYSRDNHDRFMCSARVKEAS